MKKKSTIKNYYQPKLLALSIAAVTTSLLATTISQASDIEIYQEAKSGEITLMFMIDISGSMTSEHSSSTFARPACELSTGQSMTAKSAFQRLFTGGPEYRRQWCEVNRKWVADDRITRVKDGMMDLLYGNPTKNITRLSDDKVIGLSTLAANNGRRINTSGASTYTTGAILVPSRRLDAQVNGKTQRQILIDAVANLEANGSTPTTRSYAEAIAYMMGTNTQERKQTNYQEVYYFEYEKNGDVKYRECTNFNTRTEACTQFGAEFDGKPELDVEYNQKNCSYRFSTSTGPVSVSTNTRDTLYSGICHTSNWISSNVSGSGFEYSASDSKVSSQARYREPSSLRQTENLKACSGQGIYILTDGDPTNDTNPRALLRNAIEDQSFICEGGQDETYACANAMAKRLLDPSKNPLGIKVKTAIVGFGGNFNNVTSYDPEKTEEQNIAALGRIDTNVKKSAYWGIIGQGGWYSGNNSQDVVDSVNNFITNLATDIPSVTTGSPTIPKDALNPAILQDDAYYQQFQPTPDQMSQLWLGNLKKYFVDKNGILKGKDGNKIIDSDGKVVDNFDYWSEPVVEAKKDADENTVGSAKFALRGGAWSRLLLRTDPINNPQSGTLQRKVWTNRIATGTGSGAVFGGQGALRQVVPQDLTDSTYKNDEYRGYLMRALGYNVDVLSPPTRVTDLASMGEFRQTGAVMHSYPLLITNKGKLTFDKTKKIMSSTNREDYILFGTTQGVLHVVEAGETKKAGGGREVFSFVPNEMLEKQRQAFEKPETTNGGLEHLFYGIDGAWTAHTEYVINANGELTVGTGIGSQKGVQDVYGGLRMGGKSYYALDLKNMNAPELKFHIDPENQKIHTKSTSKAANELQYMGQSWSKPTIGFVNWNGKRTRVMFVGGGYDMGYESVDYNPTISKGNGVYMFDANNGDLLWWTSASATNKNTVPMAKKHDDLKYSVVSQIRTVDRDGDELVDHIYFGDLGGQIFRIDFDNKQKLAVNLAKNPVRIFNGHLANGKSPRFYDMPAFSLYSDNGSIFAVVSQGSGNRSKPLFGDSAYNYDAMYNIYDKDVARKDLYSATSWNTKDIKADNSLGLRLLTDNDRQNDSALKAPVGSHGWYYEFTNCLTGKGACNTYTKQTEKVFGTPVVLNKKMFVSTFDASKDGLSGDCGAGVKGASIMTTFCMPFGQCKAGDPTGTGHSFIGPGIHTITVGNEFDESTGTGSGSGSGSGDEDKTSASNYCVNTGGRMTLTISGGESSGEQTQMCLIPQRWYPKLY